MYGYIYITYCKINEKIYIGQKKGKYNKNYYGSGAAITRAIDKYGKENFENHIIQWCETFEELNDMEIYWISKYNCFCNTGIGYNISVGGHNGNWIMGKSEDEILEFRKRISDTLKGRYTGDKNPMYGRNAYEGKTEEEMKLISKKKSKTLIGRKQSREMKEKLSKNRIGNKNPMYGKSGAECPNAIQMLVYYNNNLFGKFDSAKDAADSVEQWFLENKGIKCKLKDGLLSLAKGNEVTKRSKLYGWRIEKLEK